MTLVRKSLTTRIKECRWEKPNTDSIHLQVWKDGISYDIFNVYSPPKLTVDLDFEKSAFTKTLIGGDFNGQATLWGYKRVNNTGRKLLDLCNSTNLCIMQSVETPPTCIHTSNGRESRPDLTIISSDLRHKSTLNVLKDIGSDHLPILIKIGKNDVLAKSSRPNTWRYQSANWTKFASLTNSSNFLFKRKKGPPPPVECTINGAQVSSLQQNDQFLWGTGVKIRAGPQTLNCANS
ncbi:unnamed protein product [Lymnaea stagnalis]|uniref:Endonuclease/exonuclease/phosphatase domain-containing protein n=1 Tax=Lymnaea stagnalis TaxID=6523 RepID=A0AAV2HPC7_LYMST